MLHARAHGTTIDSNYNTVTHYMFGHNCPKQSERYENRIKDINNSAMSSEQKNNARTAAGYMNAWGS